MKLIKLLSLIFNCVMILALGSLAGKAQDAHFSISYSPIIPVSFMQDANIGLISGNIGFSIDLTKKVSLNTTVGYNKFGTKTATIVGTDDEYKCSLTFIPVTTGIQYFFKEIGTPSYKYRQKSTRLYGTLKAGYYFPSGDLVKGDPGLNTGPGVQFSSKTGKSKFDISLSYNGVLGAKTKVFESGSLSQESIYQYLSYLAFNFGLEFGL